MSTNDDWNNKIIEFTHSIIRSKPKLSHKHLAICWMWTNKLLVLMKKRKKNIISFWTITIMITIIIIHSEARSWILLNGLEHEHVHWPRWFMYSHIMLSHSPNNFMMCRWVLADWLAVWDHYFQFNLFGHQFSFFFIFHI